MVVKKKIDKDRQEIISRGAKVTSDVKQILFKMIPLRIPEKMLDNIEKSLEDRPGLSRNAWILEALKEKLDGERNL